MKKKKGLSAGQAKALHEKQDGTNYPTESPKGVLEESESSSVGSDAELESALNKFFGGPPYCLILPDCIQRHTEPRTSKRVCRGRVQSFHRSYPIVTWMDVLSEATTADQFQLQANGMYWCRIKGRVVEISAENYHFIALGYPQRMMQSSHLSEVQRGQETAGAVAKQGVSPFNAVVNDTGSLDNSVPDPMDITRSSIASDISHQTEKSTTVSHQSERDVKGTSHVAQEFQDETSRLRPNNRQSDFQSRHKESFYHWTPILVANNPVRPEDDPIKSDITTRARDGSTGSSGIPQQSPSEISSSGNKDKQPATPVRRRNVFIPWTPSPKKETRTQGSSVASNTSPRAGPAMRYSSRELREGPAFIKSLIEAGASSEEQEELYASKFGISRSQFRLVKKFDLIDMKDGGFEKAAFKKAWKQHKPQSTSANMETRESSVPTVTSQASGEGDRGMGKGKKRDPGPSDAA
ncbi:unnamed protein product [Penicillium egyptiacum]|uniref:Uncharacterized protein n=1 Tax=Penicillium egyptiacum TaxID=1303716 RepID=A0A9W4K7Y1_9EURO|nr:unnamed protein product [Penicillium egyptiacum]